MSLLKRGVRPSLSSRRQILHRRSMQSTSPTTKLVDETPAAKPTPPPSVLRRYRAALVWATLALGLGLGAGTATTHIVSPPPLPAFGSHEDGVLLSDLNKRIDEEFKVKVLRGKCLGVTKALKGEEGGWVEILPVQAPSDPGTNGRLPDQMRGAKGLGVERIFYDRGNKKLVAIVWFGGSLSGWPGVTHGGLLATALTEKIALANYLDSNSSAERLANAAVAPQRLPGTGNHATLPLPADEVPAEAAQLSIDYVKPTYANNFHVIRVVPSWDSGEDVRLPIKGHEYIATLETLDARTCVKATAKFDPKSQMERAQGKVEHAVGWSYQEFKEWMWPSRQRQSQLG